MVYYIEVNVICAIILLIVLLQMRQNGGAFSADQSILKHLIWASLLFCGTDIAAGVLRGRTFPGAREMIEISNLLYYEVLVVISYLWSVYVRTRLTPVSGKYSLRPAGGMLPGLLFTAVALTNPWTHFLFRINSQGLYERGPGIYLHWVVVWSYFLFPTFRILKEYMREKHRLKRQEIAPMLYFAVAPALASLVQMLFYGVTSTQVGITVSIVLIYFALQNAQVLTDALTGINNRRGLDHYLAETLHAGSETVYVLLMIDIDDFKSINDQYGHMTGDLVLQSIAASIKNACKVVTNRLFICRFGGDEFVIFGAKQDGGEIDRLQAAIMAELQDKARKSNLPAALTVSIGVAEGPLSDEEAFKRMLSRADEAMYAEKKHKNEATATRKHEY